MTSLKWAFRHEFVACCLSRINHSKCGQVLVAYGAGIGIAVRDTGESRMGFNLPLWRLQIKQGPA